jgi:hypothetical protein
MTRMESGRQSESAARVAQRVAKTDDENDEDEGPANDPAYARAAFAKATASQGLRRAEREWTRKFKSKRNHSR